MRELKALVVSDIHATSQDTLSNETWARTYDRGAKDNAIDGVREFVEERQLHPDLILCPGDLSHRGDPDGLKWAWEELHGLSVSLGGVPLIATAGNHDVLRAFDPVPPGFDAHKELRGLTPEFPACAPSPRYWNDDFDVVQGDGWRVVAVNSCAEHGASEEEQNRGNIRDSTLHALEQLLKTDSNVVNILLCHHHPVEWTHLDPRDTSHMRNGEALLRLLDVKDSARWIVLHGHKHHPALGYAGDGTSGPVRFSAGSVACPPYPSLGPMPNQFYELNFDLDEIERLRLPGAGRFRAWDWCLGIGSAPAGGERGLPAEGGFGFRRDGFELASLCLELAGNKRFVTWAELLAADERWKYVAPADLREMVRVLREHHHANVTPADGGGIAEITL